MSDIKKCKASDNVLLSNPLKNKCKDCGNTWITGTQTPDCNLSDIKQRAREMFDERWKIDEDFWRFDCGDNTSGLEYTEKANELKDFQDKIIDLAVEQRDKELVEMIRKIKTITFRKEDIINLITNSK